MHGASAVTAMPVWNHARESASSCGSRRWGLTRVTVIVTRPCSSAGRTRVWRCSEPPTSSWTRHSAAMGASEASRNTSSIAGVSRRQARPASALPAGIPGGAVSSVWAGTYRAPAAVTRSRPALPGSTVKVKPHALGARMRLADTAGSAWSSSRCDSSSGSSSKRSGSGPSAVVGVDGCGQSTPEMYRFSGLSTGSSTSSGSCGPTRSRSRFSIRVSRRM